LKHQNLLLLIEVADSTFKRDRGSKSKIYARAGIPEYWIVNLKQRQVLVFQNPQDGDYQIEQTFGDQDRLTPLLMPDIAVDLRQLIL
jgi:Uma2 family endonuclease